LRIALLSAVKLTESGEYAALLPFLGGTVLSAQCELAIELGAERIVCIISKAAHAREPKLIALQHAAEKRGLDFHLVATHLALTTLVSADHELIVIEDGVLIDRAAISAEMVKERGILSVPAEGSMALGFERIDAQWAWAGLLIARADIASKLADLPADSDPAGLLLRLALQARVPIVALGNDHLAAGTVLRPGSSQDVALREARLFGSADGERSWAGPGGKLAQMLSVSMMPRALGSGSLYTASATGLLGFAAACFAVISLPIGTGISLIVAAFAAALYSSFQNIENDLNLMHKKRGKRIDISALLDAMIVVSLLVTIGLKQPGISMAFAPLSLGLMHIAAGAAERDGCMGWQQFWEDRMLLAVLLFIAIVGGYLLETLAVLCLAALLFILFYGHRDRLRQA
jgi:hypothetical protein